MTVKDRKLYVGGIGMEYVLPNGAIASEGGKFVKIIDHTGCQIDWKSDFNFFSGLVEHVNWKSNYDALRDKAGYRFPAYIYGFQIIYIFLLKPYII